MREEVRGGGSRARGEHDAGARARGSEGWGLEGARGERRWRACARKRWVGARGREGGMMPARVREEARGWGARARGGHDAGARARGSEGLGLKGARGA